jgi:spermidine synthase
MPVSRSASEVPVKTLPSPRQFGPGWLVEVVGAGEVHAHQVGKRVTEFSAGSARVEVLETSYGRILVKNARLQSTQNDEWIYHEALVHPGMLAHPNPRSILCVGGTTGAIIREVLRHKTVEKVLVYWVDPHILQTLDRHLPYAEQAAIADPRVKGVYSTPLDASAFQGRKFDVVIADPPEPSESGAPDQDVYRHVVESAAAVLSDNGILAIAGGAVHPVAESISTLPEAVAVARRYFGVVELGIASVPSLGIPWGMLFCSQGAKVMSMDSTTVDERLHRLGLSTLSFYDGETHRGMFAMPKHVRLWLTQNEPVRK